MHRKSTMALMSLLIASSQSYGLTGLNLPNQTATFASLLKTPDECTSAHSCPSGAYLIPEDDAQALFGLGTIIGGSQDGQVNGAVMQWSDNRYAILVPAGSYAMKAKNSDGKEVLTPFKINYYTQVLGVGADKKAVIIAPGINALNDCFDDNGEENCKKVGGLNNFWRGIEDATLDATGLLNGDGETPAKTLRFAISQAAPIRNVDVTGKDVLLCDWWTPNHGYACGYTSGGFLRGSDFSKDVLAGSQQQYYFSDSSFPSWQSATWNMVSVNNTGALELPADGSKLDPSTRNPWPNAPFTQIIDTTVKTVPKKPHLVFDGNQWGVIDDNQFIPIDSGFYVVNSTSAVTTIKASEVNAALSQGKNILFMPGVYKIDGTIKINHGNTVVLGIGMATLIGDNNNEAIIDVSAQQHIHIAGLTLQAGAGQADNPKNTLLMIGDHTGQDNNSAAPVVLQDIFCRVADSHYGGGSHQSAAYSCVTINSNNVIGEDLWLWRADHDAQSEVDPENPPSQRNLTTWHDDKAQYGIIINGDNVTMLGLAVEHFQNFQTVWNGKAGKLYFYQSEMPYNVPGMKNYQCVLPAGGNLPVDARMGCASLVVTPNATGFIGKGLGIYSYFVNPKINPTAAILAPSTGIKLEHIIGRWLNGDTSSYIQHLVEDYQGKTYGIAPRPCLVGDTTCNMMGPIELAQPGGSALAQYPASVK